MSPKLGQLLKIKLGQLLKIIKLTRLELFYEEKLWIYTYDLQENNITITQIQLVLVAAL